MSTSREAGPRSPPRLTSVVMGPRLHGDDARNFDDSRALRGLDHHHIVFTAIFLTTRVFTAGLFMAGVPFQAFAPHGELVAHEFIAELERLQSVGRDGAVAQSDHGAAQDR